MSSDVPKSLNFPEVKDWYLGIVLKKFADFNGRARRKEFWYFFLANLAISFVLGILSGIPLIGWLFRIANALFGLAIFIPSIAISVRRLHDTDRKGLWLLLSLTIVGGIVLLVWACMEGTSGSNQYGPDPKKGRRR